MEVADREEAGKLSGVMKIFYIKVGEVGTWVCIYLSNLQTLNLK